MIWFDRILAALRQPSSASSQAVAPLAGLPPDTLLIDVRSRGEFNSGHIEGALNLPLDGFGHQIASAVPDKATPLLLYCRSGARSGQARDIAMQMGYLAARNGGAVASLSLSLGRHIVRA